MSNFYTNSDFIKSFKKNVKQLEEFIHSMKEKFPQEFAKINYIQNDIDPHFLLLIYSFCYLSTNIKKEIHSQKQQTPKQLLLSISPNLIKPKPIRAIVSIDINNSSASDIVFLNQGAMLSANDTNHIHTYNFTSIEEINLIKYKSYFSEIVEMPFFTQISEKYIMKDSKTTKFLRIFLEMDNLYKLNNKTLKLYFNSEESIKILHLFSEENNKIFFKASNVDLTSYNKDEFFSHISANDFHLPNSYSHNNKYSSIHTLFMFRNCFKGCKITIPNFLNVESKTLEIFIPTILDTIEEDFIKINILNIINLFPVKTNPVTLTEIPKHKINLLTNNIHNKIFSVEKVFISDDKQNKEISNLYYDIIDNNDANGTNNILWSEDIDENGNVDLQIYGNNLKQYDELSIIYANTLCFNVNLDAPLINTIQFMPIIPSTRIKVVSSSNLIKNCESDYYKTLNLLNSNLKAALKHKKNGTWLFQQLFTHIASHFDKTGDEIKTVVSIELHDYIYTVCNNKLVANILGEKINIIIEKETYLEFYISLIDFFSINRYLNYPTNINILNVNKTLLFTKTFGTVCVDQK